MLEWIGAPYEAVKVDHADPEFHKINPAGAVPALDDGLGHPLTQCAAILQYLAHKHPDADLLDARSLGSAAELQRWLSFLTGDLHPAFFPIYFPGRYTISADKQAQEDVRSAAIALVRTKLRLLNDQFAGHPWALGDKRTLLDAYATPMLNWAVSLIPGGLNDFPALAAHHQMMMGDPAVHKVMADEGLLKL